MYGLKLWWIDGVNAVSKKSMSTLLEEKKHNKLWAAHSDTDSKQAIALQSFHIFNPLK